MSYTYPGNIPGQGTATPQPIIDNFRAIEEAFKRLDSGAIEALIEAAREMFPNFGTNGGAIFTKRWPEATAPVAYALDNVFYGTHIIPVGAGGDVSLTWEKWPEEGTKYITLLFFNAGRGVIRWPSTLHWQTRGNVPPVMKDNGTDTIVIWRDSGYKSVTGQDVVFAAKAGI